MILNTVLRGIWVVVAFGLAALIALVVLFALGATWMTGELRAAAPDSPAMQLGAPWLSAVLFAGLVAPALTVLPALVAVVIGEVLRLKSWIYYVLAGGASLAAVPLLIPNAKSNPAEIVASHYLAIFLAAGFAGGFIYWLLAGRNA